MMNTNMRRLLKNPTLRMMDGGDLQVPKGPGMDRAGMLARNPGVAQNQTASPSPGQFSNQPAAAPASLSTMPAPTPVGVSPMPGSVNPNAGKYGSAPIGAPVDQGAAMDRKMLADSAATRAAAPPVPAPTNFGAPTTQPTRPVRNFDRQAAILTANQDVNLGLAAAGLDVKFKHGGDLRTGHGGLVPGSGKGDKIAAKYEPGEFVVSNAMLDKAPGLRDMLHGLRSEALADKGMTPEQADAKAVSGPTLRANGGYGLDPYVNHRAPNGPPIRPRAPQLGYTPRPPSTELATRPYQPNFTMGGNGAEAARMGPDVVDARAAGPGNPNVPKGGSQQAQDYLKSKMASAATGVQADPRGMLRRGLDGAASATKGAWSAVKSAGPAVLAGIAGSSAAQAARGIGDPANDKTKYVNDIGAAAQIPTANSTPAPAAQPYNFFSDDELGRNIGNTINALGPVGAEAGLALRATGATGKVSKAMTKATDLGTAATAGASANIRSGRDQTSAPGTPGVDANMPGQEPRPAAPVQKLVTEGGRQYLPETVSDADRLQSDALVKQAFSRDTKNGGKFSMDDGINTLRSDPNAMATANKAWAQRGAGIQASYDSKGGLVLSNSTGPEKMQYTDREGNPTSKYENTSQFDQGQQQLAQARASLRNPDGSTWSAQDNALMAANLRDGVSPYAGTSRADKTPQMSPLRARLEAMGGRGMSKNQATTLLSLREADQRNEVAMAQNQTTLRGQDLEAEERRATAAGASAAAQRVQANDDRKYELDVARLGVEQANKARDDKRAGDEALDKRIEGMSGKEDAPAVREAVNGYLAKQEAAVVAALAKKPNDPALQGELKSIQEQGRSGINDPLLRKLIQGIKANRVAQQGSGSNSPFNPFDGTSVNTNQPVQTLRADQSFTSRWLPGAGKYVTDNGQKILASDVEKNPDLKELIR